MPRRPSTDVVAAAVRPASFAREAVRCRGDRVDRESQDRERACEHWAPAAVPRSPAVFAADDVKHDRFESVVLEQLRDLAAAGRDEAVKQRTLLGADLAVLATRDERAHAAPCAL